MAGSSSGSSHSESQSDTYIPEYSQTPVLMEIAQHARSMSDQVYNWGMDVYNKNQGDIDSLMRDALSYASPQRIAVDMGMAEAGVQMAAERGRLSAVRDLESYGIDPSSGRYAALDMAERVKASTSAAGAGNQQRMADQAAGNAMRNQAISAGLQNANFGSQVGRDANAFLNTAMQLKYPPLGRQSTSVSDSQNQSSSSEGGGSKGGGKDDKPKGGNEKAPPADKGQPLQGGGARSGSNQSPVQRVPPEQRTPPNPDDPTEDPKWTEGTEPVYNPLDPTPTSEQPFQTAVDPTGELSGIPPELQEDNAYTRLGIGPDGEVPGLGSEEQTPNWPDPNAGQTYPPGEDPVNPYDPYADNVQTEAFTDDQMQIDPATGEPLEVTDSEGTSDVAGSLYGLEETGWTGGLDPVSYDDSEYGGDFSNADLTTDESFDSTYDNFTDAEGNTEVADADITYDEDQYGGDWGGDDYNFDDADITYDEGTDDYGDYDYGDYDYGEEDYGDYDWGDEDYSDDDYDYGDEDYDYGDEDYDYGEEDYDYGDEDYSYDEEDYSYDEEDYGEEDYGDEDYGDEDYDYGDEEDYGDQDYDDYTDDYSDYEDTESGDDYSDYDDSGDYGSDDGGDYARGGVVRKKRRRKMRARPPTGYGQRPMPRMARGGRVPPPPQPGAMRMAPPPQPQQAPRPMRGAPAMARGGPRPPPMGRGMGGPGAMAPGNFISPNGMPPPAPGGMPRPQRMAAGGQAGRIAEPTTGGFVSPELSPSRGSTVDDVEARLNAGEFVVPKDVAAWKGKEFFYKLIAQARANRSAPGGKAEKPQSGYSGGGAR